MTLALERTLLAWTRTALALIGFGFVVARLPFFIGDVAAVAPVDAVTPLAWLGAGVVAAGIGAQTIALISHALSVRRIRRGDELTLRVVSPAYVLGILLLAGGLLIGLYIAGAH